MIDEPDPYETTGLDALWAAVLTADPGPPPPDDARPTTLEALA